MMKHIRIIQWSIILVSFISISSYAQVPIKAPIIDTISIDDVSRQAPPLAIPTPNSYPNSTSMPTLKQRIKIKRWNEDYIHTQYQMHADIIIEPYQLKRKSKQPIQSITEQYYSIERGDTIKKYGDGLNTKIELDSLGRYTAIYIKEDGIQVQDTFHLVTTYHYKEDKLDHKIFYEYYGGSLSYKQWYVYDIHGNLMYQYLISYDSNQSLEYKGVKYKYTYLSNYSYVEEQYEDDIDSNFYLTQVNIVYIDSIHRKTQVNSTDYGQDSSSKSIIYNYIGNTKTVQYNYPTDTIIQFTRYNDYGEMIAYERNDNIAWNDYSSHYTYDAYHNWVTQLNVLNADSTDKKELELVRRKIIYYP